MVLHGHITLLIDADIIAISAACMAEKRMYRVDDDSVIADFSSKEDAINFCKKFHIPPEQCMSQVVQKLQLSVAKRSVDSLIDKVKAAAIKNGADSVSLEHYLTGEGNFRVGVAKTTPYKGSRRNSQRPLWERETKQYIVDKYNAVYTQGIEADDALAMRLTELGTQGVVCSIDKDLLQVPGWHYNWRKDTLCHIDEATGMYNFYCQMLTGDTIDDIKGIYGIGPVKAGKILENKSEEDMRKAVIDEYITAMPDTWTERYEENYRLLWLLRSKEELAALKNRVLLGR